MERTKRQLVVIVSIAVISFLVGTGFSMNYFVVGGKPPSVWDAISDLQAQISELQTQLNVLNATKLGVPDYDSGWMSIQVDNWTLFEHDLNTKDLLVYVLIKTDTGDILQGYSTRWTWWQIFSENEIGLYTSVAESGWTHRVMLWKIPQP